MYNLQSVPYTDNKLDKNHSKMHFSPSQTTYSSNNLDFKIELWLSAEVLSLIYKIGGAKDSQQKFSQICLNYFKNSHIPSYAIPRARHF